MKVTCWCEDKNCLKLSDTGKTQLHNKMDAPKMEQHGEVRFLTYEDVFKHEIHLCMAVMHANIALHCPL